MDLCIVYTSSPMNSCIKRCLKYKIIHVPLSVNLKFWEKFALYFSRKSQLFCFYEYRLTMLVPKGIWISILFVITSWCRKYIVMILIKILDLQYWQFDWKAGWVLFISWFLALCWIKHAHQHFISLGLGWFSATIVLSNYESNDE